MIGLSLSWFPFLFRSYNTPEEEAVKAERYVRKNPLERRFDTSEVLNLVVFRMSGVDPRPIHVALGRGFSPTKSVFPCQYHRVYTTLSNDSVAE
jgi:hypothetical protein